LSEVSIVSVEFDKFKSFVKYSLKLDQMNILVGPNNCGKSTIINAFRALAIGLRKASSKSPVRVLGPKGFSLGHYLSDDALPMSIENVHTDYAETDSSVIFKLSNKNSLILFFPLSGGTILIPDANGQIIYSPSDFKKAFPIRLDIVPVLGPLEHNEDLVVEDTIKKNLSTHRASRHFRNYWHYYPEGFENFSKLISKTWPGMEIQLPNIEYGKKSFLTMFCSENRILRELYWAGFGFQIWCQLLTHISRCQNSTMLIIDEPEIYLHPNIQRQLIGILRDLNADILVATHSSEILSEADPSEVVLVEKSDTESVRLRDSDGIQYALNQLGSIHNLCLSHLARTKKMLFLEGPDDYKILCRFAKQLDMQELASGIGLTPLSSGGFAAWEKIESFTWAFKHMIKAPIAVGAIFDRDYWPDAQVVEIKAKLDASLSFAHIHKRKEIENYLLEPSVIERVVSKLICEREKRTGIRTNNAIEPIMTVVDQVTQKMKIEIQSQYIAKYTAFANDRYPNIDPATHTGKALSFFESRWNIIGLRLEIVSGKQTLKNLREYYQARFGITLTTIRIIQEFFVSEIPDELQMLIHQINQFRSQF